MGEFGHEIRTGRHNQDGIGPTAEVDVGHAIVHAAVPGVFPDGAAGQRLHGGRGDKASGGGSHDHVHGGAFVLQAAQQLGGFIAGDAAGQPQDNAFSKEIRHGGVVLWMAGTAAAQDFIQNQQHSPAGDGDIGHVKGWKIPVAPVKQQKIHHMAVQQAVQRIA